MTDEWLRAGRVERGMMGNRKQQTDRAVEESSRAFTTERTHVPSPDELQLNHGTARELEEFFASSGSTFGLKSKFSGLVQMAMSGGHSSGTNTAEDAMIQLVAPTNKRGMPLKSKVGHYRAVLAALNELEPRERLVLWVAHGYSKNQDERSPELKKEFEQAENVVFLTPAFARIYDEDARGKDVHPYAWIVRACKSSARVAPIKREANALLKAAHVEYEKRRGIDPKTGVRHSKSSARLEKFRKGLLPK